LPPFKTMELSRYIKVYPYEGNPGTKIIFSTKKSSLILLSEDVLSSIKKDNISPHYINRLKELGIIVEDKEEEQRNLLNFIDTVNSNNSILNLTVILNLDCNFSCVYCYEGDFKGRLYMSESTADLLIDFLEVKTCGNITSILIDFYGGEPLLSKELIKYISKEIIKFTKEKEISYNFSLVTNGSLFDRKTAQELIVYGLDTVKITLDGPPNNHNKYRPFKSGAGTFDLLLNNLKNTCDIVKITLGGNYDSGNYTIFPQLLDLLETEGLTPDKINIVKFDPIINRPEKEIMPGEYRKGCLSINEPWLLKAENYLREEILKRKYNYPKISPTPCVIEINDSYIVNYDGLIYKCPAFIGREEFAIGSLQTELTDPAPVYQIGFWKNTQCLNCEYLPLCFGGCRYIAYVRDGKIDQLDCRKEYLDNSLEILIKQDLKYRSKAPVG